MTDVNRISDRLANDPLVTDYDFWRAIKDVEYEIHSADTSGSPIPIDLLQWRKILRKAQSKRQDSER
ncbi:hypothetical protein [Aquibium oceanicum]|uniref:Uncharacterized protein n=1 Tax=Aquibium oceanicum TaxID=1670800 RepID=A0A1L3SSF0_9HYPH|nr:hypothetical protein [Aquibium oceanicum]APH72255.1 hypothetical protein BSQ44_13435 [Aquibium oceanicum]